MTQHRHIGIPPAVEEVEERIDTPAEDLTGEAGSSLQKLKAGIRMRRERHAAPLQRALPSFFGKIMNFLQNDKKGLILSEKNRNI